MYMLTILCRASSFLLYFNVKYCTVPTVFVLSVFLDILLGILFLQVSKFLPIEVVKASTQGATKLTDVPVVLCSISETPSFLHFWLMRMYSIRLRLEVKAAFCVAIIISHEKKTKNKIKSQFQYKSTPFSEA